MSILVTEKEARAILPKIVERRRFLHSIPEAGLDLPETLAYVVSELKVLGLDPVVRAGGAWVDIGDSKPVVAIRADMDALPVSEKTGKPYASKKNGFMHACGHDAHTSALLAAAELLLAKHEEKKLGFTARLIFQPGEEGFFGAPKLIDAGCLEGVSSITGAHVGDLSEDLPPGYAGFIPGPMMAAADLFRGVFTGSGGHGSAPHKTPDPVSAFAEFVNAIEYARSREFDQRDPVVISVCSVSSGSAHNIIPETLEFSGTARTLTPENRDMARERIESAGKTIGSLRKLDFSFEWTDGYPPLVNDPDATRIAVDACRGTSVSDKITTLSRAIMGGEDFAYYLEKVPGCFWFLNTQSPEKGIDAPNHNPRFDVDESLLWIVPFLNIAIADAYSRAYSR